MYMYVVYKKETVSHLPPHPLTNIHIHQHTHTPTHTHTHPHAPNTPHTPTHTHTHTPTGSTAYSSGAEQSFQVTSNVDTELFHDPVQGYGDIDTMMSTMSHDLSKEGINTLPKGHCAACNKLIVGQVCTVSSSVRCE